MNDARAERRRFVLQLALHPELATTHFIAVADSAEVLAQEQHLVHANRVRITTIDALPSSIRAVFAPSLIHRELAESTLSFPIAENESERLLALERSGLLNTASEPAFDRLIWLASQGLKMPISLMTLLTSTQQRFKSRIGLELTETPRSWAICNHTILQKHVYAVADLARTPLFAANPAVAGSPHFRFYAGAPFFDSDGFALGSICVMDYEPHEIDTEQRQTLLALAALASDEVRLRAKQRPLRLSRR